MLELSTLVFKVNTEQLTEAIDKTNKLTAAQKLLAESLQKGGGAGTGGAGGQQAKKPLQEQQGLLVKLDNLYKDLAQGATRWEASQLRAARQMGVPLEAVREQLVGIRKLSQDPFDSAIGSVRSITQHFEQLQNRISLANEGLLLTAKQMREFSRIPFEVEGQMQAGGKSPKGADNTEYLRRIKEEERSYIDTAKAANTLADAEKDRSRVLKQNAQAHNFLATEMQRVDAVLAEMNNKFGLNAATGERSAAAVAKYSTALQRAGISGTEAALRLEAYRVKIQEIAMQDEKRAAQRLSRSLTPQISDVAVSIAGGMPLHLVIMQQGLQIRDLIAQSGVAQKTLQGVFKTAAADMVSSIGGVVKALGILTFGAIAEAGNAIVGLGMKMTGLAWATDSLIARFPTLAGSLNKVVSAIGVFVGGAMVAAGAAIVGVVYEYIKLIGANNALSRSLAETGAVFGVVQSQSSFYVEKLTKVGATTRDAIEIIAQMADSGKFTASQLTLVGKAAVEMERYAGVAIKDTIKTFEDMAKDPVKALTALAIKTGDVSPKVLQLAYDFQEQGKMVEASALGVTALAEHTSKATQRMQEDLHPLTKLWIDFKHAVSEGWTEFGNAINRAMGANPVVEKMQERAEQVRKEIVSVRSNLDTLDKFGIKPDTKYLDSLNTELDALREGLKFRTQITEADQRSRKENAETAKQVEKNEANELTYMSKKEKARKELDKLYKAYTAPGSKISVDSFLEKEKELEEQLVDKGARAEKGKQLTYELGVTEKINDAYNQMIASLRNLTPLEKALADIRDDRRFKSASEEKKKAIEEEIRLLQLRIQPELDAAKLVEFQKEQVKDLLAAHKELAAFMQKESKHGREYESRIAKIDDLNFRGVIPDEDVQDLKNKQFEHSNVKKSYDKFTDKFKGDREKLALQQADLDFENSMLGQTEKVRQYGQIQLDLKKKFIDIVFDYEKDVEKIKFEQEGDFREKSLDEAKRVSEERKRLAMDEAAFKSKLLSEEVQRQKNVDDTIKRGFESMGDALIDFAATGKSSFGDMIKQMLIDLAKLEMRLQMMKLYEAARGGSSGGGGMLGSLLGNFGGGVKSSTTTDEFGQIVQSSIGSGGGFLSSLGSSIGSLFGFAKGGAFENGVQKFANGASFTNGIVSKPINFSLGQMGEAGPEAIVPLKRARDGSLGIASSGKAGTSVNMNQTYNIQIDSRSDQAAIYAGVQSMLKQNNAQLVDNLQTGGYL